MSDSLTELEMAVNAWVTFATKKVRTLEQLSVFTIQRKKDVIKDKKGTKNIWTITKWKRWTNLHSRTGHFTGTINEQTVPYLL